MNSFSAYQAAEPEDELLADSIEEADEEETESDIIDDGNSDFGGIL